MKTIEVTITAYKFSELSEKAKLKALIEHQCNCEYSWGSEAIESLKVFMIAVGVDMYNYDIDWLSPNHSKVYYDGTPNGKFIKEDLTGMFSDYSLTTTWNKTKSIELAVAQFLKECADDYEHQLSEEGYAEHCDANDYWFDENGKLI